MGILLKYFQFENVIYHFPEHLTDRAIHSYSNRFTLTTYYMLYCHVIYHTMQFAIFLFTWLQNLTLRFAKILQLLATLSPDPCRGCVPHWGLQYPKAHKLAPNSRYYIRPSPNEGKGNEDGVSLSHSSDDQRIWGSVVSSPSEVGVENDFSVF